MGDVPISVVQNPRPIRAVKKRCLAMRHDHLVPSGFFQWANALHIFSVRVHSSTSNASLRQHAHKPSLWKHAVVLSVRGQPLPTGSWSVPDTLAGKGTLRHTVLRQG